MTDTTAPHPLIAHLVRLHGAGDRGALASLRRGLGKSPGTTPDQYPHVVPFLPADAGPARTWPYFLVAGLFASHPSNRRGEGFGRSFHRLPESPSRELRFKALLNSDTDELPAHLRQAVRQLATKEVSVDWDRLLHDLLRWSHPSRFVQQRWARDFWAPTATTAP